MPLSTKNHTRISQELSRLLKGGSYGRAFLVGADRSANGKRTVLKIHAPRNAMSRQQSRKLSSYLLSDSGFARCKVARHSVRTLERAQSLEAFVSPFMHDEILFDPTGVFDRAGKLVRFAHEMRRVFGPSVKKLLWDSRTGTLFTVLDRDRFPEDASAGHHHMLVSEPLIRTILQGTCERDATDFISTVRVCFSDPGFDATPIDNRSLQAGRGILERIAKKANVSAVAAFLGIGSVAVAQADDSANTNQAVSAPNGELAIMGGALDDQGTFVTEGAFTMPLAHQYGARIDGTLGAHDGDFFGGGALHLFWRNPDMGLFGFAAGFVQTESGNLFGDSNGTGLIAAEGEYYLEQVTFSGLTGYQFSEGQGNDGFMGRLDFEWYLTDDLLLTSGAETNPNHDFLGRVGVEYRPGFAALPGLSLFAEGAFGDRDFYRAYGGIRFYFGGSETLKDRHRHDTFRSHLLPTRMADSALGYGD